MPPAWGGNPAGGEFPHPHFTSEEKMKMINLIHASGALKKFLDARAQGASPELLTKLSAESLLEAQRPSSGERPRLRLVFSEGIPAAPGETAKAI
jgi:hypothetical protein